ncbi:MULTISPECIES: pseudouridine synthase [Pseudoalteromonas]|uniref:Pseudouridine synthase n=1 Tax=Pseudoalteromonas amylolytica TaxID=1859457 RepID=A0A1S1MKY6_9GAMM|nr:MULTISPECIES: pseudouridine synthase [Pseudoalteromonas]OHU87028.1 pseudouridine synthase [Pseudoalteromonas sp. JW3]OHU88398.1 pseudouridine synthase [Pseudoalteromonas amylolytica]
MNKARTQFNKSNRNKPKTKFQSKRPVKQALPPEQVKIILFNKPYDVLCQFTDDANRATLANYIKEKHVYAAGRLDRDSEGLLLLTNCGKLQHQLTNPNQKTTKTYWVQVEGVPSNEALKALSEGVELKDGLTRPATVKVIEEPDIWPRTPPIRERASIPTTWLSISISEGKNRQVRRMTAHVGHPTLRLIRAKIGKYTLDGLKNGEYKILSGY